MIFGAHDSVGLFGTLGDLVESIASVSAFAFPIVLNHTDNLNSFGLGLCFLSNICFGSLGYIWFLLLQESY